MGTNQWGAPFGYSQMLALPGYIDNLQSSDIIPVGSTVTSWAGRSGVITLTPRTTAAIYVPNAQNSLPSVDGNGTSIVMSSGLYQPPSNRMLIYMVAKLPVFTSAAAGNVLFEFGSNSENAAGVKGVTWSYRYNPATFQNPTLLLQSGSLGGTATIKGTIHTLGSDSAANYRAYCISINRSLTWPMTAGAAVAPGSQLWISAARQAEGIYTAQSGVISQFDNTNFNFFGRWTGAAVSVPTTVSILSMFLYAPDATHDHTFSQIRNGMKYLSAYAGV